MDLLRLKSRLLCASSRKHRRAIRELVTPFTPYLISDYYLSKEVRRWGITALGGRSKNLRRHADAVVDGDRIYCEIDLLPELAERHLPRIDGRFVLIAGRWQLPKLRPGPFVDTLLRSEKVVLWFAHNQGIAHPKCRPFPYGICHLTAPGVAREAARDVASRARAVYHGYVGVHDHLTPEAREARGVVVARMEPQRPHPDYLRRMHDHRFVASPQGDRPDTYRHWEAVALGCVPISDVPRAVFEPLFGRTMVFLDRMRDILQLDLERLDAQVRPDPSIGRVTHWVRRLDRAVPRVRHPVAR